MERTLPRILFIDDFPYLGGAQVALLRLASGLDRYRCEVAAPGPGPYLDQLQRAGIPTHAVPLQEAKGPGLQNRLIARVWRNLLPLVQRADIVHANSLWAALVVAPLILRTGVPLVMSIHAFPHVVTPWKRHLFTLLGRAVMQVPAAILVVSDALAQDVTKRFGAARRTWVIPNGVAVEALFPEGSSPLPRSDRITIGMFGRLHPGKGQGVFVDALARVRHRHRIRAVIVGDECAVPLDRIDYTTTLRRQINERGLAGQADLTGPVDGVGPAMEACDVVVLPSDMETFGLTLIEAGALGKPVVASRVGGIPEVVVDSQTGLLVPPRDPEALAAALDRLIESPDLRRSLGRAGQRRALSRFPQRRGIVSTQQLYDALKGI